MVAINADKDVHQDAMNTFQREQRIVLENTEKQVLEKVNLFLINQNSHMQAFMKEQEAKVRELSSYILEHCEKEIKKATENAVELSDKMHESIQASFGQFHEQFAPIE